MKEKAVKGSADKEEVIEIPIGNILGKLRNNPWILSTVVLAIVLVAVIVMNNGVSTGGTIEADEAADSVVTYLNSNPNLDSEISIVSSEKDGSLYRVILNYQGQDVPLYTTIDGKYLVGNIVPLSGEAGAIGDTTLPGSNEKVEVSEDDDAVLGKKDAPVTIVEFSDYQCPYCRKFWTDTLPSIMTNYIDTGKVKLIYRDYPLDFHEMAIPSAIAAECVKEKWSDNGYYKFHDKLFEEQNVLDGGTVKSTVRYTEDDIKKWAKEIGYNIDKCLDDEKFKSEVEKDQQEGVNAGVTGTPGFFVNGIPIEGALPFESFKQIIDAELAKTE